MTKGTDSHPHTQPRWPGADVTEREESPKQLLETSHCLVGTSKCPPDTSVPSRDRSVTGHPETRVPENTCQPVQD